jgi:hypothetical protein
MDFPFGSLGELRGYLDRGRDDGRGVQAARGLPVGPPTRPASGRASRPPGTPARPCPCRSTLEEGGVVQVQKRDTNDERSEEHPIPQAASVRAPHTPRPNMRPTTKAARAFTGTPSAFTHRHVNSPGLAGRARRRLPARLSPSRASSVRDSCETAVANSGERACPLKDGFGSMRRNRRTVAARGERRAYRANRRSGCLRTNRMIDRQCQSVRRVQKVRSVSASQRWRTTASGTYQRSQPACAAR